MNLIFPGIDFKNFIRQTNQRGVASLLIVVLLVIGIGVGILTIQSGTGFLPIAKELSSQNVPVTASMIPTIAKTIPANALPNNADALKLQPRCQNGQTYQNGACVYVGNPRATSLPCPSGQTYLNGACVFEGNPPACPNGQTFQNGTCVYIGNPPATSSPCPSGQMYVNGACVYEGNPQSPPAQSNNSTISVEPSAVSGGGTVTINWFNSSGPVPPTEKDWIGLYRFGTDSNSDDKQWIDWFYTSSCTRTASDTKPTGTCAYTLPKEVASGNYEFRLFSNNGYAKITTSSSFSIK